MSGDQIELINVLALSNGKVAIYVTFHGKENALALHISKASALSLAESIQKIVSRMKDH